MSLFQRGKEVDLTLWQKRGLIKAPKQEPIVGRIDSRGYVDLTQSSDQSLVQLPSQSSQSDSAPLFPQLDHVTQSQTTTVQATEVSNPFAFMDMQATQTTETSYFPSQTNSSNTPNSSNYDNDISSLKITIENIEYKLDNLTEKLYLIESKLSEFERKTLNR